MSRRSQPSESFLVENNGCGQIAPTSTMESDHSHGRDRQEQNQKGKNAFSYQIAIPSKGVKDDLYMSLTLDEDIGDILKHAQARIGDASWCQFFWSFLSSSKPL